MHPVQQIDRDAACEYLKQQRRDVEAGMAAIGEYDAHPLVQAFAAFRILLGERLLSDWNLKNALQRTGLRLHGRNRRRLSAPLLARLTLS